MLFIKWNLKRIGYCLYVKFTFILKIKELAFDRVLVWKNESE